MKNSLLITAFLISGTLFAQTKVTVIVENFMFTSANITINVGDTVEWTNIQGTHNVNGTQATFPSNPASFGNAIGGSPWNYTFVFTIAGSYNYQCDVHAPNMAGTVTVQAPTGVDKVVSINQMGFYPNPASNELSFVGYTEIINVSIFAITGKKVLASKLVKDKLDISTLSSGTYFVKVVTNDGEITEKLIVQ